MISLPSLLILAQALSLSPTSTLSANRSHSHHHHGTPTPDPTPAVKVTIVNASCVPSIALGTQGTNKLIAYPNFPQGEWTANQSLPSTEIHYVARSTNGELIASQIIKFKPVSSQFLLITGDLSRNTPPHHLPQLSASDEVIHNFPPNFQFHVIPYSLVSSNPCHYQFINAMPGKILTIRSIPGNGKPPQQLAYLAPGNSALLVSQPGSAKYEFEVDGQSSILHINQEGAVGNCIVPFFLRNGNPDHITVFEDP